MKKNTGLKAVKTKIGYKVVESKHKQYHSYLDFMEGSVRYFTNKFVGPKEGFGPLCVFGDLEYAMNLLKLSGVIVFECEYVPSKHKSVWLIDNNGKKISQDLNYISHGAILANSVKLLKRVKA